MECAASAGLWGGPAAAASRSRRARKVCVLLLRVPKLLLLLLLHLPLAGARVAAEAYRSAAANNNGGHHWPPLLFCGSSRLTSSLRRRVGSACRRVGSACERVLERLFWRRSSRSLRQWEALPQSVQEAAAASVVAGLASDAARANGEAAADAEYGKMSMRSTKLQVVEKQQQQRKKTGEIYQAVGCSGSGARPLAYPADPRQRQQPRTPLQYQQHVEPLQQSRWEQQPTSYWKQQCFEQQQQQLCPWEEQQQRRGDLYCNAGRLEGKTSATEGFSDMSVASSSSSRGPHRSSSSSSTRDSNGSSVRQSSSRSLLRLSHSALQLGPEAARSSTTSRGSRENGMHSAEISFAAACTTPTSCVAQDAPNSETYGKPCKYV